MDKSTSRAESPVGEIVAKREAAATQTDEAELAAQRQGTVDPNRAAELGELVTRDKMAQQPVARGPELRRVNVNFTGEAYEALVGLAQAKGKTLSDVLREAIALEQWVEQVHREGGRLLVERNGNFREVVRL